MACEHVVLRPRIAPNLHPISTRSVAALRRVGALGDRWRSRGATRRSSASALSFPSLPAPPCPYLYVPSTGDMPPAGDVPSSAGTVNCGRHPPTTLSSCATMCRGAPPRSAKLSPPPPLPSRLCIAPPPHAPPHCPVTWASHRRSRAPRRRTHDITNETADVCVRGRGPTGPHDFVHRFCDGGS